MAASRAANIYIVAVRGPLRPSDVGGTIGAVRRLPRANADAVDAFSCSSTVMVSCATASTVVRTQTPSRCEASRISLAGLR